jgi:hypothetical protein
VGSIEKLLKQPVASDDTPLGLAVAVPDLRFDWMRKRRSTI